MTLAETASIMCETVVNEAVYARAADDGERLAILENALINDSQIIVDIYSRYLFEKELMERREKSELSPEELCDIMDRAQAASYGDGLDGRYRHRYMWTWKPHYYAPGLDFYNFPYAFGLLFGTGLYSLSRTRGPSFAADYESLLALHRGKRTPRTWLRDSISTSAPAGSGKARSPSSGRESTDTARCRADYARPCAGTPPEHRIRPPSFLDRADALRDPRPLDTREEARARRDDDLSGEPRGEERPQHARAAFHHHSGDSLGAEGREDGAEIERAAVGIDTEETRPPRTQRRTRVGRIAMMEDPRLAVLAREESRAEGEAQPAVENDGLRLAPFDETGGEERVIVENGLYPDKDGVVQGTQEVSEAERFGPAQRGRRALGTGNRAVCRLRPAQRDDGKGRPTPRREWIEPRTPRGACRPRTRPPCYFFLQTAIPSPIGTMTDSMSPREKSDLLNSLMASVEVSDARASATFPLQRTLSVMNSPPATEEPDRHIHGRGIPFLVDIVEHDVETGLQVTSDRERVTDAELDARLETRGAEIAHCEILVLPGDVRADDGAPVGQRAGEPQGGVPVPRAELQHAPRPDAPCEHPEERSRLAADDGKVSSFGERLHGGQDGVRLGIEGGDVLCDNRLDDHEWRIRHLGVLGQ